MIPDDSFALNFSILIPFLVLLQVSVSPKGSRLSAKVACGNVRVIPSFTLQAAVEIPRVDVTATVHAPLQWNATHKTHITADIDQPKVGKFALVAGDHQCYCFVIPQIIFVLLVLHPRQVYLLHDHLTTFKEMSQHLSAYRAPEDMFYFVPQDVKMTLKVKKPNIRLTANEFNVIDDVSRQRINFWHRSSITFCFASLQLNDATSNVYMNVDCTLVKAVIRMGKTMYKAEFDELYIDCVAEQGSCHLQVPSDVMQ